MNDPILSALEPGERVEWRGVPARGLRLTSDDVFVIPFSLFWCGVVFTGAHGLLQKGDDLISLLFFAPFMAVGVFLLVLRFPIDAWIRRGMSYAVTNRRILVTRRYPSALFSLPLERLDQIKFKPYRDGSGSIEFGGPRDSSSKSTDVKQVMPSLQNPPTFIGVADARRVLSLIERARLAREAERAPAR